MGSTAEISSEFNHAAILLYASYLPHSQKHLGTFPIHQSRCNKTAFSHAGRTKRIYRRGRGNKRPVFLKQLHALLNQLKIICIRIFNSAGHINRSDIARNQIKYRFLTVLIPLYQKGSIPAGIQFLSLRNRHCVRIHPISGFLRRHNRQRTRGDGCVIKIILLVAGTLQIKM